MLADKHLKHDLIVKIAVSALYQTVTSVCPKAFVPFYPCFMKACSDTSTSIGKASDAA